MSTSLEGHINPALGRLDFRGEGRWLAILALVTTAELGWWILCRRAGIAPAPRFFTYLALALAAVLMAVVLRFALRCSAERTSWAVLLLATLLVALGASLFLPLKYAIPNQVPFWLDTPLALGERGLFGTDPWRLADRLFGWALAPVDYVYGLWLPVQSVALFSIILQSPSTAKSRALIAYSLAWFLLGVVAAVLFASVGPIFYDRLLGGHQFSGLSERLNGQALMTRGEADAMWASYASGRPGIVTGISAMPSLHVAVSFWIWLASQELAPRLSGCALAYAIFISIASVQLGWHYVSDGIAGVLGICAIWWLAGRMADCGIRRDAAV